MYNHTKLLPLPQYERLCKWWSETAQLWKRNKCTIWLYILQVLEVNLTYNFYYKSQPHLTWNSLISFTIDKHKLFHLQGKTKNVYNILVTDLEIHYKFIWFPPSGLVGKQGGKRREREREKNWSRTQVYRTLYK